MVPTPTRAEQKILTMVGTRLRAARLGVGVSAEALAHAVGLDRTYVTSVERGERNVGVLNLVRLATALDLDPAALIEGSRLGAKRRGSG